ncbi:MAG TPA: XdhC family protein [Polyangiales bacterium]
MSELRACVEAAERLRAQGSTCLIATVVDVQGSSYRKRGARMVFSEERWLAGSVSGGCLERDILAKGAYRTRDGRAHVATYDALTDERSGSGCDGVIDVLIERGAASAEQLTDPLNFASRCLRDETYGVFATVFRSARADVMVGAHHAELASGERKSQLPPLLLERLESSIERAFHTGRSFCVRLDDCELLVERIGPPIHLFIFGGAHDAVPLLQFAKDLGWTVSVCEPHAAWSSRERFRAADHHRVGPLPQAIAALQACARPAAVVMAHHYERDLAALGALLGSRCPYIGLLGARKRAARLLDDLAARGIHADGRVHAPVGLAIAAESPQEIALAIAAEVQAELGARALATPRDCLAKPA